MAKASLNVAIIIRGNFSVSIEHSLIKKLQLHSQINQNKKWVFFYYNFQDSKTKDFHSFKSLFIKSER